jgi:hypothetical protein
MHRGYRFLAILLSCLGLIALTPPPLQARAAAHPNLLHNYNSSFEEGLTDWEFSTFTGDPPPVRIVNETAHANCGVKALQHFGGTGLAVHAFSAPVPMSPNTRYRMRIWMKIDHAVTAGLYVFEQGIHGKHTTRLLVGDITSTGGVWKPIAATFTSIRHPGTMKLFVSMTEGEDGSVVNLDCAAIKLAEPVQLRFHR